MPVHILCPTCRVPLRVADEHRAGLVRCPRCKTVVSLPAVPVAVDRQENREVPGKRSSLLRWILAGSSAAVIVAGAIAALVLILSPRESHPPDKGLTVAAPGKAPSESAPAVPPAKPAPAAPPPVKPTPEPKEPDKPPPHSARAQGTLPLEDLKAATVYIKTKAAHTNEQATGSGFVIRTQGDTVLVITNHHVIAPRSAMPLVPRPPFELRYFAAAPVRRPDVEITVVFRSGTLQEQSTKVHLLAFDETVDLAVLEVKGVQNVPRPIACDQAPKLSETMTVLALGFPFGSVLAQKRDNPAVTVSRGAVSSLQRDARGELAKVQLQGDLYPGNSGGPVVDETGALVGVAVAKIENTRIGFAVPVLKLQRLMKGQIDLPDTASLVSVPGQGTRVEVILRVADPLGKLRALALLYGLADELKLPARGADGWEGLAAPACASLRSTAARPRPFCRSRCRKGETYGSSFRCDSWMAPRGQGTASRGCFALVRPRC